MNKYSSSSAKSLLGSLALGLMLLGLIAPTASASILFQDDAFHDIESDAIRIGSNDAGAVNTAVQFGNDVTPAENGKITWDIGTNRFGIDNPVDITGDVKTSNGFSATGGTVDFSASARDRLRESTDPTALAACTGTGEVIINTTANRLEICTATGVAGAAVWTAPTPQVPTGAVNPATCAPGQLFLNSTTSTLDVCSSTNTWETAGPQNFEQVYNKDADKTLTTLNGNFSIDAGTGTYNENAAATNIFGTGPSSTAISLSASDPAGGITGTWGTGGLNFASTTGAFSITGSGSSTIATDSGNLNLSATTSGNVALTASGAGNSVTFADSNVTTPIKFSNVETALNATFGAGAGILDAINSFTSTAPGNGASNVGIDNTFTNITGTDVQSALASIDSKIGAASANVEDLTFNPEYPNFTIFRDGTDNSGTMVSDYDPANASQFFDWTSNQVTLQDNEVKFRFPLPADFTSVGDFTLGYRTGTTNAPDNHVDVTVSNSTNLTAGAPTACGSSTNNTSSNSWLTATITSATLNAGCTGATSLDAGDMIEVDVKLFDVSNVTAAGTYADAGQVKLLYNN